jgi:hypothetical protein
MQDPTHPHSTISSERSLPGPNHEIQLLQQEVRSLGNILKTEMGGMRGELTGVKVGMHAIAGQVASLNLEVGSLTNQVQQGFAGLSQQNQQILQTLQQIQEANQQLIGLLRPRLAG